MWCARAGEIITIAVILFIVLASVRWRLDWGQFAWHAALAVSLAVVSAAPYLPTLFNWLGAGAAYSVGLKDPPVPQAGADAGVVAGEPTPFVAFGLGALGINLPIRLALFSIGVVWVFRKRMGRAVIAIGLVFTTITAAFTLFGGVGLHQVYAAVLPRGMHYRIFMAAAIAQVLVGGAGGVVAWRWIERGTGSNTGWARRVGRSTRILVITWSGLMTWATTVFLVYPASLAVATMGTTTQQWPGSARTPPESVLANNGYADAGIWRLIRRTSTWLGLGPFWPVTRICACSC